MSEPLSVCMTQISLSIPVRYNSPYTARLVAVLGTLRANLQNVRCYSTTSKSSAST